MLSLLQLTPLRCCAGLLPSATLDIVLKLVSRVATFPSRGIITNLFVHLCVAVSKLVPIVKTFSIPFSGLLVSLHARSVDAGTGPQCPYKLVGFTQSTTSCTLQNSVKACQLLLLLLAASVGS